MDGVFASVASTQKSAEEFVSGVKGGVDSVSSLAQKAAAVATGKEKKASTKKVSAVRKWSGGGRTKGKEPTALRVVEVTLSNC